MAIYEVLVIGITIFLHVTIAIKICRGLNYLCTLFKQNAEKEKIYIYPFNLRSDLKETIFSIQGLFLIVAIFLLFFYPGNFFKEHGDFFVAIFISTVIWHFSTHPDTQQILEIHNLQIGHGAALAYYKNYLEMNLTERFSERVDKFKSANMIKMPKKLFILVPRTCREYSYLDSIDHENIERCRELPEEEISHSGIKNRKYNITVYNIDGLRMAVEVAQPLKAFNLFKEKGLFTMDEMLLERKVFTQTLKTFQKEDRYKYFEIIEYDDSAEKIYKVLTKSYDDVCKNCYDPEIV